jgi:hypothetical protein
MKNYQFVTSNGYALDALTIKAKSKLDALKLAGFNRIYWRSNTPYGCTPNCKIVFAIIVN